MIADDLFAGAGGWCLAAAQLGIHARGVENMKEARATRDAAGLTTIHDDVWTFRPKYVAKGGGLVPVASGLIASPPCQTFSAAGKGSGRKALDDVLTVLPQVKDMTLPELRKAGEVFGDDRTALVLAPLWFALHHGYQWLAWEQVPTVLPVWEACAEVLRAEGWNVWAGNLHAEQYGVPQTRKRAFLLASRTGEVAPPTPTHSRYYSRSPEKLDKGVEKWVSMAEALGWAPEGHMRSNYGTGGDASKRGERLLAEPAPTVTSKIDRNRWVLPGWPHTRPAPTVVGSRRSADGMLIGRQLGDASRVDVGGHSGDVGLRPGQLPGVRVTVHEAGVLQSFPADYPWQGGKGKQFLQAGNAVPPGLALHALAAASGVALKAEERAA